MSNFTDACERQATSAWHAVSVVNAALITKPAQSKRQRPAVDRVKRGCLYFVIFWIPGIVTLIRYMLAFTVVAIVALYALLVSAVWGVSALVDAIRGRTP